MTQQSQVIEQVAGIIFNNLDHMTFEGFASINKETGWTFEVRWHDGDYVSDNDYTRVECRQLSEVDLRAAYDMACAWQQHALRVHQQGRG